MLRTTQLYLGGPGIKLADIQSQVSLSDLHVTAAWSLCFSLSSVQQKPHHLAYCTVLINILRGRLYCSLYCQQSLNRLTSHSPLHSYFFILLHFSRYSTFLLHYIYCTLIIIFYFLQKKKYADVIRSTTMVPSCMQSI